MEIIIKKGSNCKFIPKTITVEITVNDEKEENTLIKEAKEISLSNKKNWIMKAIASGLRDGIECYNSHDRGEEIVSHNLCL